MDDTFTELSKIFRSVSKLVRERTEDYLGHSTPLSRVLREVADEDNCSVPNSVLREVASASNASQNYHEIMNCVWTCLDSSPSQWRRIYKALCLLEYLVLLGPSRVLEDCSNGSMRIRNLSNFRFHDGVREQGGGVRQKAMTILEFVEQPSSIVTARQKVIDDAAKYVGIENKPVFEHSVTPGSLPSGWGELGGAWRSQPANGGVPLPPNPYASMQRFQTAEDAARAWGIEMPNQPPALRMSPRVNTLQWSDDGNSHQTGLSVGTIQPLPADEEVFGSAPNWWDTEETTTVEKKVSLVDEDITLIKSNDVAPTSSSATKSNPVMTVNLLDDDDDDA